MVVTDDLKTLVSFSLFLFLYLKVETVTEVYNSLATELSDVIFFCNANYWIISKQK